MARPLCQALCAADAQASKTETLPQGTRDGGARGDCNIAGPQQRHLALCALVLSSVKWAQCQIHRKHGMCVGCYVLAVILIRAVMGKQKGLRRAGWTMKGQE